MGCEPLQRALEMECQVVLAGRCYDPANFAALPIMLGYDPALALHLGKILECGAIAATPGSGADCVLGTLRRDSFLLEALNPQRRFTRASAAAHTLYEKSDPYHLPGPGGVLDLEDCVFTELGDGRVEVKGSRHQETKPYCVKLEGARKTGCRAVSIAGVRDPRMIAGIDAILEAVREQVADMTGGFVHFHVYGRDGVMGPREPLRQVRAHELGIVIEAVAPTQDEADALLSAARSTLLHYGYPGRIATAGNLGLPLFPIRPRRRRSLRVLHLSSDGNRRPGGLSHRGRGLSGGEDRAVKKSILDVAQVVRSKNSGPYELTLDILFAERRWFELFRRRGIISPELICRLYDVQAADILGIIYFEPAWAVKITLRRPLVSGSPGDGDVYGAQQHAPLLEIEFEE